MMETPKRRTLEDGHLLWRILVSTFRSRSFSLFFWGGEWGSFLIDTSFEIPLIPRCNMGLEIGETEGAGTTGGWRNEYTMIIHGDRRIEDR